MPLANTGAVLCLLDGSVVETLVSCSLVQVPGDSLFFSGAYQPCETIRINHVLRHVSLSVGPGRLLRSLSWMNYESSLAMLTNLVLTFWMVLFVSGTVLLPLHERVPTWKLLVFGNLALLFCDAVEDVGLEGSSEMPRKLRNWVEDDGEQEKISTNKENHIPSGSSGLVKLQFPGRDCVHLRVLSALSIVEEALSRCW